MQQSYFNLSGHTDNSSLSMRLVLFEPDIPQNTGAMLRLAACFGVAVDLVEPFGFIFDEKRMRRAGMDYLDQVTYTRHRDWHSYLQTPQRNGRLVVATTKGADRLDTFEFLPDDNIIMGRESSGVTPDVHAIADARVCIPMAPATRSLNVSQSAAIILSEALRQTKGFPQGLKPA